MRLIVFSKVLKYRALYIGIALLLTLAFFQSNQSLDQSSLTSNSGDDTTVQVGTPETPSTTETPDFPENPDLPDNGDSSTKISISIKTTTNTNELGEESESGGETIIEKIEREITNGSISLVFTSSGGEQNIKEKIEDEEGKISVKFKTKSDLDSENDISQETVIKEEISSD